MASGPPVLSVILISRGDYSEIRRTTRHFTRQSIAKGIEIVLVTTKGPHPDPDLADMAAFHSHRVVEIDAMPSTAAARAAGVRAASAPRIAFAEEHSYPGEGWAEIMVATLDEGFAAVGPGMHNANPGTALSWANLLPEYGQWMARERDVRIDHIPGHNGAYRRDVLLDYGERLEDMLIAESVLHWDLRRRGLRLCLEPRARTYHINISRWRPTAGLRFRAGRVFAAKRAADWPLHRRILYILGSPLIPIVRLKRTIDDARRIRASQNLPRGVLPATLVTIALDSLGEAAGYAVGEGDSLDCLTALEFDRRTYLAPGDTVASIMEGSA